MFQRRHNRSFTKPAETDHNEVGARTAQEEMVAGIRSGRDCQAVITASSEIWSTRLCRGRPPKGITALPLGLRGRHSHGGDAPYKTISGQPNVATGWAGPVSTETIADTRPHNASKRRSGSSHVAIAHIQWASDLFGYTGRLHQPLVWISRGQVQTWCRAHLRGILLTSNRSDEPAGSVSFETWRYFLSGNHRIAVWRASDILAAQR